MCRLTGSNDISLFEERFQGFMHFVSIYCVFIVVWHFTVFDNICAFSLGIFAEEVSLETLDFVSLLLLSNEMEHCLISAPLKEYLDLKVISRRKFVFKTIN